MSKIIRNKKLLFGILCPMYFYSFIFKNFEIFSYMIYYVVPIVFMVFKYKKILDIINHLDKRFWIFLATCFLLGSLSIILPVLYNTNDFTYFTSKIMLIGKEFVKIGFLYLIYVSYISPENDPLLFLKYYIFSTCLYVLFTFITIIIPPIRDLVVDIVKMSPLQLVNISKDQYFTRFGWSGYSGFTCALKSTLAVAFCVYIIIRNDKEAINVCNVIFLLISFIGGVFYGRIGMFVSGLLILVGLVVLFFRNKRLAVIILTSLLCLLFLFLILSLFINEVRTLRDWAFQIFINLFETGSFSTSSTDAMLEMYIMPSLKTLLFGDGLYTVDGAYYMSTDIGLLRPIYFGGIIFQGLRYFSAFILLKIMKQSKIKDSSLLCILILLVLILFELKGEVIFIAIAIIFVVSMLCNDYEEKI